MSETTVIDTPADEVISAEEALAELGAPEGEALTLSADELMTAIEDEIALDGAIAGKVVPAVPLDPEARKQLQLRVLEALLFAASAPLDMTILKKHLARGGLDEGADITALLSELKEGYRQRGVQLYESQGGYGLRTAPDLADYLRHETVKPVKLSRAVAETLAIIAYHQPVTRAEIESVRGVAVSRGVLDYLMQLGWVRPGKRRETAGRPLTWVTTPAFLDHFALASTNDLPAMDELRAAGLLEPQALVTYGVMAPSQEATLVPAVDETAEHPELPDGIPEFLPSAETVAEAEAAFDETEETPLEAEQLINPEDDLIADIVDTEESSDSDDDDFDDDDDDDFVDSDDDDDDDFDDDDFDDDDTEAETSLETSYEDEDELEKA